MIKKHNIMFKSNFLFSNLKVESISKELYIFLIIFGHKKLKFI